MNWFAKPKRVERNDIVFSVVVMFLVCFLVPSRMFANQNMNWFGGLVIVFPVTFVAGLFASEIDPAFYIRAWWALVAGSVAWPLCLLFRPIAADSAFVMLTFGAGPVAAFHVQRHYRKALQTISTFAHQGEASFTASLLRAHGFTVVLLEVASPSSERFEGATPIQLQVPNRQVAKAVKFLEEAGATQSAVKDDSKFPPPAI